MKGIGNMQGMQAWGMKDMPDDGHGQAHHSMTLRMEMMQTMMDN
jgi:hypothetical protein